MIKEDNGPRLQQQSIGHDLLLQSEIGPPKESCKGGCKKLLWFMGVQSGLLEYYEYIKTAVLSAHRNAPSLLPVLLYEGVPNNFTAWYEIYGRSGMVGPYSPLERLLHRNIS